jgi:uncharacterized protein (DUF2147 family)
MKRYLTAVLLVALTACSAANDPTAESRVTGNFLAGSGNIEVRIARCGAAICGTITRVLTNRTMGGSGESTGEHNDVGLQILTGFAPAGDDTFQGHILNRENGKVYECIIRAGGPGELVVRPYVVVSWFGQTQLWHRVP